MKREQSGGLMEEEGKFGRQHNGEEGTFRCCLVSDQWSSLHRKGGINKYPRAKPAVERDRRDKRHCSNGY